MNKVKSVLWGTVIVAISVGLASLIQLRPQPPIVPGLFTDRNPFKFILGNEESVASSIFGPHVWYNSASNSGSGLTPGNSVATSVQLPSTPDHLPVCFEFNYAYMANTSGAFVAYGGPTDGTANSEDSGCPLWPYNSIAGHAFGPGIGNGNPGYTLPTNGDFVTGMDFRQDGMYFNSVGACGGNIAINSATFAGGTVTLNLAGNPQGSFASGLWSSTGNGEYMQVTGSSVAALNTTPGQVYTVTGRNAVSLSFAGTAGQACASNCGTVYQPYLGGAPPVTLPVGFNGGVPQPQFAVMNAANSGANINWSETINIICVPLMSCPNQFGNLGCGIGNTMQ